MVLLLPYHQDERLADPSIPVPGAAVVEPELPATDQWTRLVTLYDALATEVAGRVGDEPVPVLTGDCLAAAGTFAGLQRAGLDPAVVWFDAHADLHTLDSSTSGYLGGVSLRALVGGEAEKLGRPLGLRPVAEERCLLVGARDIDPAEREYLGRSVVRQVSVPDLTAADLPDGPLLVHVDLDVIDESELPGLRFPVSGGPTTQQITEALDRILATGRVAALDIACPWHDPTDAAQSAARSRLLAQLLASGQ